MYSMGYRLLRICGTPESFEYRLKELNENFLIPRGYKQKLIDIQFERLRNLPGNNFEEKRNFSLEKKPKENNHEDRIIVPINFNPHMARPSMVMKKHYTAMIKKNENLKEVFPAPPRLKRKTHKDAPGWRKCGKPCPICPYTLPACSEVRSQNTEYTHKITQPLTCESENCIYY